LWFCIGRRFGRRLVRKRAWFDRRQVPRALPDSGLTRRDRVRLAILLNQLAAPGLGSWWMGYRRAGAGQLALALAGFVLVCWWFAGVVMGAVRGLMAVDEPIQTLPNVRRLEWGLVLFGLAWLWSGWTSWRMWQAARREGSGLLVDPSPAGGAGAEDRSGGQPPVLG
jgi:hypothetical protein